MVNLGNRGAVQIHSTKVGRLARRLRRLLLGGLVLSCLTCAEPSQAAVKIVAHYGLFESSLPIADLRSYAETDRSTPALSFFLQFMQKEQRQSLRELLQKRFAVNRSALDTVLNSPAGIKLLQQAATATTNSHGAGVQALRSAAVLGTQPEGMSVMSALEAYPNPRVVLDLPKAVELIDSIYPDAPTDRIAATPLWQVLVDYQTTMAQTQPQPYTACLFGDSISSALGNSLGTSVYNFALGGLSTVSLVEQLNRLNAKQVQCQSAVIAIGANDALYKISDADFIENLTTAIALTRKMGAQKIVLLPAFYSTLAASKNPKLAGPIPRVDTINQLIQQVAENENLELKTAELQQLYDSKTLKRSLTYDGVHLNDAGLRIYQPIMLGILSHMT